MHGAIGLPLQLQSNQIVKPAKRDVPVECGKTLCCLASICDLCFGNGTRPSSSLFGGLGGSASRVRFCEEDMNEDYLVPSAFG
jgi:hypothetical protein